MNQEKLLYRITELLSRFKEQVKILNANNEFSINIHAENALIKILNIVYGCNLKNPNYSIERNYQSIDLIDTDRKIAFQITATSNVSKIKYTIEKFKEYNLYKDYKTLYVYILTDKKKYIKKSIEDINASVDNKFSFDVKKHILDKTDLYLALNKENDLEKIQLVLNLLEKQFSDNKISSAIDLRRFKSEYRDSVLYHFSRINFFGLSLSNKPREIELYSLFVNPKLKIFDPPINYQREFSYYDLEIKGSTETVFVEFKAHKRKSKPQLLSSYIENISDNINSSLSSYNLTDSLNKFNKAEVEFKNIFNEIKNFVILGNPGAGKSSLVKYTICKILQEDLTVFSNNEIYNYLPFRIELYKYHTQKKKSSLSILQYIFYSLKNEFQISSISEEDLEQIFENINTLVFFDGLDEIFDNQERIETRNDIEVFTSKYQKSYSIVTSRYESYEEVNFNKASFNSYEINQFDDYQISEYIQKWYTIEEVNDQIRDKEVKGCLEQLTKVDDELKRNPLLLSLILILYRNELELPTSRLDIYEGCANTIIETRDAKEKKIEFNLKIGNKAAVFAFIAYWQYCLQSSKSQVQVNFNTVKNQIKNYLLHKGEFDEDRDAERAAIEFLEFGKVRSIYFENNFTHKTFLEYFTAYYIYANLHQKPKYHLDRDKLIKENLGKSSWLVVFELLIFKIDKDQTDFEILDELYDNIINLTGINGINFFLQTIKYLRNISPKKINDLFQKAITFCVKEKIKNDRSITFNHLLNIAKFDRFQIIFQKAIDTVGSELEDINDINSFQTFYLEFTIALKNFDLYKLNYHQDINLMTNPYQFILLNYLKLLSWQTYFDLLKEFIEKYSLKASFNSFSSYYDQNIFLGSNIFNWSLSALLSFNDRNVFLSNYGELKKLGITLDDLKKIGRKNSIKMGITYNELEIYNRNIKDFGINSFLKIIIGKQLFSTNQNLNITKYRYSNVDIHDARRSKYKK